jgi:hypothetical protein
MLVNMRCSTFRDEDLHLVYSENSFRFVHTFPNVNIWHVLCAGFIIYVKNLLNMSHPTSI